MSNGAQNKTKGTPRQTLLKAVEPIRSAEQLLIQASRETANPATLTKISIEYNQLDSFLSQLLHAQAIADDAEFGNATAALKKQAAMLEADEEYIKKIVSDVATAAKIIGYIAQALTLIGKLP
jgi:hypothetical protein